MRAGLRFIMGVALMLSAEGCTSNQLGPQRPIAIDEDVAWTRPLAVPDLSIFYSASPTQQASIRNQILTARMYIADVEYHNYEARLTREMQDEGLLATATSLGLTTSSTLLTPVATKTILSGIATAVTGLDKTYNEKELLSNTIQALQTQMRVDRKTQAAVIYAKMFKDAGSNVKTPTSIAEYPLPMALSDVDAYYQAGTIASALVGLSKTLATADRNADQAKSDAGPNSTAVSTAKETAAPRAPATIRDVTAPMGRPFRAAATHDAVGVGTFEQSLVASQVRKFQCLVGQSQDGNFTAATRTKILAFLADKQMKDPAFPDRITAKDGTKLRDALDARSDC